MKRNLFLGVLIILTFFLNDLFAQVIPPESIRSARKGRSTTSSPTSGKKAKKSKAPKGGDGEVSDVVTLNLTSLSFSNLSLRFEHQLKGKLSASLGVGYLLPGLIPGFFPYDQVAPSPEVEGKGLLTASGEFSGFNATPEIRFYPFSRKGAPYGFYLSAFGRYFNYDWKVPYVSVDTGTGDEITANGTLNISGIGGGATLGIQLIIKSRIVVDLFAGGGFAPSSIKGEFSSPDVVDNLSYYEDLGADIQQYAGEIPLFDSGSIVVDLEKAKATFNLANERFMIIRAGFAIGVAF